MVAKDTCYHRHVVSEPYVRSFQYKVLKKIIRNNLLFKIGYIANPYCTFCNETLETITILLVLFRYFASLLE